MKQSVNCNIRLFIDTGPENYPPDAVISPKAGIAPAASNSLSAPGVVEGSKLKIMSSKSLFLACLVTSLLACSKDDCPGEDPTTPLPVPGHDIPAIKLRTMSVSSLPSPYYAFTYNDSGYITHLSHASNLLLYDFSYAGKRIKRLVVNKDIPADINKDTLDYDYVNGQPSVIRVTNKQGQLYRRCRFLFTPAGLLQQLTWEVLAGNSFTKEVSLTFSYHADGNLKEMETHWFPVGAIRENLFSEHFEQYDKNRNVDGFTWLHTDLHHPVILPSVQLMRNNPGRVFRTGTNTVTYDARYQHFIDGSGRQLLKFGEVHVKELNGDTATFHSATTFTY